MEPHANDDHSLPPLQPKTSIPKSIGIMNIVFGILMLLCLFCSILNLVTQSAIGEPIMGMQKQQFEQAMQAERETMLRRLQEREKASNDEKEKAELKVKQKELQAQPPPKMPDVNKFAKEIQNQGFMIVDLVTGFSLNILMIISGVALIRLKEWGRVTAIWVALLKIIRLVALYTVFALVIVPDMVRSFNAMFQEMFDEMAKAAPPGQKMPAPGELAQIGTFMGIAMTASAVGMIIFGVIYPIIVLIALTRPRVKAACTRQPEIQEN